MEPKPDGAPSSSPPIAHVAWPATPINVVFAVLYLLPFLGSLHGGRASSCLGFVLIPVLLVQLLTGFIPALHAVVRRQMSSGRKVAVVLTAGGSVLLGAMAAILSIVNESGC